MGVVLSWQPGHTRALPPSRGFGVQGGRFGTRGDYTLRPVPGGNFFNNQSRESSRGILPQQIEGPGFLSDIDVPGVPDLTDDGFVLSFASDDVFALRFSSPPFGATTTKTIAIGVDIVSRQLLWQRESDDTAGFPVNIEGVFCFGDDSFGNDASGASVPRPTSEIPNISRRVLASLVFSLWTPGGVFDYAGPNIADVVAASGPDGFISGTIIAPTESLGGGGFRGLCYALRTVGPFFASVQDFVVIDFNTGSTPRLNGQFNSNTAPIDEGPINSIRSVGRGFSGARIESHPSSGTVYLAGNPRTTGGNPDLLYAVGDRAPLLICLNVDGTERWRVTHSADANNPVNVLGIDVDGDGNCWVYGRDVASGVEFPGGEKFDGTRRAWRRRSVPGPLEATTTWVVSPSGELVMYFLPEDIGHTTVNYGDATKMLSMIPGPRFFDWENPPP